MTIVLYRTNKRENSLLIPSGTGVSKTVVLKEKTSLTSPVFVLNYMNVNPTQFNYCYCSEFLRYYFIRDWVFDGRMWEAHCEVDVLASFKEQIKSSSYYVLRSTSNWDLKIVDTKYPAKAEMRSIIYALQTGWETYSLVDGYYVVGVIGWNGSLATSGVAYYSLKANKLSELRNFIFRATPIDDDNNTLSWDDLSVVQWVKGTITTNMNMFQYISSIMWFPISPPVSGASSIHISYWNTGIVGDLVLDAQKRMTYEITIPKHPLANSRGQWLNCKPFSYYTLYAGPFGGIDIDPMLIKDATVLKGDVTCDMVTGVGGLQLWVTNANNEQIIIGQYTAQIGVSQISAGARPISSGFTAAVNSGLKIASGVESIREGNSSNGISQIHSGLISATEAFTPQAHSSGQAATGALFSPTWILELDYFEPTEEDTANFGRPLCAQRSLSGLSGYCQVADGLDAKTSATPIEKEKIKRHLEGGFYIE